jgi:hypothetical protein
MTIRLTQPIVDGVVINTHVAVNFSSQPTSIVTSPFVPNNVRFWAIGEFSVSAARDIKRVHKTHSKASGIHQSHNTRIRLGRIMMELFKMGVSFELKAALNVGSS